MSHCLQLVGGAGRVGQLPPPSFELHAPSQSCHLTPFCTCETLSEPGIGFHAFQALRHVVLRTPPRGHQWRQDRAKGGPPPPPPLMAPHTALGQACRHPEAQFLPHARFYTTNPPTEPLV